MPDKINEQLFINIRTGKMPVLQIMVYYKRHLPHWQPAGAEYFITFRLAGSLPVEAINNLKSLKDQLETEAEPDLQRKIRQKIFQKYENYLDRAESGPTWLKEEKVEQIVHNALHFYDDKQYNLYAFCIMPNHVHVVFKHLDVNPKSEDAKIDYPITKILHSIKSYSALECNKILNRNGPFWQSESYDRVIRDQDELENTIRYTLNNPVKAGLVKTWQEWPHTYCKPEFIDTF